MSSVLKSVIIAVALALAGSGFGAGSAPGTVAASTPGQVRLAVLLVTLPTAQTLGVTPADVADTYFGATRSVAALYSEASAGSVTITGDVLGPYAIAADERYCSVSDWATAADEAATARGVDLGQYNYFAYLFPSISVCPWAGLADIGGHQSFINGPAHTDTGLYHAAHELGHNLGADHAGGVRCQTQGSPVALAPAADCSIDEYADPFSVMGTGVVREPSAWERLQMGLLSVDEVTRVGAADFGRYRLAALDDAAAPSRLLLIHRPQGGYLTVEYRQPDGAFDNYAASDPAVNGLMIRLVVSDSALESELIDTTPGTASFGDAPLLVGRTLRDPDDGIQLTLVSADSAGAVVELAPVSSEPDLAPPSAPSGPWIERIGLGAVTVHWGAATDDVRVAAYQVRIDGRRAVTTTDLSRAFTRLARGWHIVSIWAIDEAGNRSTAAPIRFRV